MGIALYLNSLRGLSIIRGLPVLTMNLQKHTYTYNKSRVYRPFKRTSNSKSNRFNENDKKFTKLTVLYKNLNAVEYQMEIASIKVALLRKLSI